MTIVQAWPIVRGLIHKMVELEIPVMGNGKINFYGLESSLESIFCNDPKNTIVDLIGRDKFLLKEVRDTLQSSFDYKILNVGKRNCNYLIKIGVKV